MGSLLISSWFSFLYARSCSVSWFMLTFMFSVLVGLILSAMFFATSIRYLVAALLLVGLSGLVWYSSLIHLFIVASCSASSLLRSFWVYSRVTILSSVGRLICRASAICWLLRWGLLVMSSAALLASAVLLASGIRYFSMLSVIFSVVSIFFV